MTTVAHWSVSHQVRGGGGGEGGGGGGGVGWGWGVGEIAVIN